jgi:hypothetical protein
LPADAQRHDTNRFAARMHHQHAEPLARAKMPPVGVEPGKTVEEGCPGRCSRSLISTTSDIRGRDTQPPCRSPFGSRKPLVQGPIIREWAGGRWASCCP